MGFIWLENVFSFLILIQLQHVSPKTTPTLKLPKFKSLKMQKKNE